MRFNLYPSPAREEYLYQQQADFTTGLNYARRIYSTTSIPDTLSAFDSGVFGNLLFEDDTGGTGYLMFESGTGASLHFEDSSGEMISLVHVFSNSDPVLFSGAGLDKSSGSDQEDLSVVFKENFFKPGDVLVYQVRGQITENAANTSLTFTITFPDSGSSATVSMPSTVSLDALSDWTLEVTSTFGFDESGNATVSHTGRLTVTNTDETTGQSTSLLSVVSNTFDFEDILYYKPQVSWNAQNAGSTTNFQTAFMVMN